jgi:uncharacterized protein (UPF0335 family)
MDENTFDLIMQEVLEQKQRMEHLEEENRQLRQQLADLCEAQGRCLDGDEARGVLIGNASPRTTGRA